MVVIGTRWFLAFDPFGLTWLLQLRAGDDRVALCLMSYGLVRAYAHDVLIDV